jgi:hypothetical protein
MRILFDASATTSFLEIYYSILRVARSSYPYILIYRGIMVSTAYREDNMFCACYAQSAGVKSMSEFLLQPIKK